MSNKTVVFTYDNSKFYVGQLTVGKHYIVSDIHPHTHGYYYTINNDDGFFGYYSVKYFISLEEYRGGIINSLIDE